MDMGITSSVFIYDGAMPKFFSCEGMDIYPQLNWNKITNGTKSLVMIVDDHDALDTAVLRRTWVHWLL